MRLALLAFVLVAVVSVSGCSHEDDGAGGEGGGGGYAEAPSGPTDEPILEGLEGPAALAGLPGHNA